MLYNVPPLDFKPEFNSAGIFIDHSGDILLLHRILGDDTYPDCYCNPSGRSNPGEKSLDTIIRETFEETNIRLKLHLGRMKHLGQYFLRYPQFDFTHDLYQLTFDKKPEVVINPEEHDSYLWTPPKKALLLKLVLDLDLAIRFVYRL